MAKACKLGSGGGCFVMGTELAGEGEVTDQKKAAGYFDQGCKLTYNLGCTNLGLMLTKGVGVAKDVKRAAELFKKACDLEDGTGCSALGNAYLSGRGVTADAAKPRHCGPGRASSATSPPHDRT